MPRQGRAAVAEQAKVDFCPNVECYNVQQLFSSPSSNPTHFFMICRPFCSGLLLERGSMLEHLRPSLLAILQEEPRVKLNATRNLDLGGSAMLAANLEKSHHEHWACRWKHTMCTGRE